MDVEFDTSKKIAWSAVKLKKKEGEDGLDQMLNMMNEIKRVKRN